jgi:hypothetical protein
VVEGQKSETEPGEPDPGERIAGKIVEVLVVLGVIALLSKLVIPAFTDWRPPSAVVALVAATGVGIVAGSIQRRRREERPYETQLDELRRQAEGSSSPEPAPRRSQ